MTEDVKSQLEITKFNLENPQLMQPCACREIVLVALHFEKLMGKPMTDDQAVGLIMRALGGKANPITLREEIKKQRGG